MTGNVEFNTHHCYVKDGSADGVATVLYELEKTLECVTAMCTLPLDRRDGRRGEKQDDIAVY